MADTFEELQELERKRAEREQRLLEVEKSVNRREVTFNTDNYVVMANNMVLHSASNLNLNELKLLRFIIMQTEKGDKDLFEFDVAVKDLCKLLDIKSKDMYKRIDTMTTHLMQEVIRIGDDSKQEWRKFHWVDVCEYKKGIITIKLSEQLKPFLLGLRGCFTRYQLSEIISLKSTYAIRIYEMINGYLNENNLPHADVAIEFSISIDEIRRATDTEKKFERYSAFKTKVIDNALKEINEKSKYYVTATPYKRGKTIVGFEFLIESQVGHIFKMQNQKNDLKIQNDNDQLEGQMNILDYQDADGKIKIK
jgi:plasmid replication initiation protein